MRKLYDWLDARFPLTNFLEKYFKNYYVPKNLNFFYVFGVLAIVVLLIQLVSGLWLTMFYTPSSTEAFNSIQYLMRDINYGWLFRYVHTTGASGFFIIIYLHIFKSLLYGSYQKPRELVWLLGMMLFFLMMMEAFFGGLLPWGQMSYWSVEVITSLFSVIPYVGESLVTWIRGDYNVANATLQRFFALHVIGIPLLVLLLVICHILSLHKVGANNPEGIEIKDTLDVNNKPLDGIPFHPVYTGRDLTAIIYFLLIFFIIVFYMPKMGGYFIERANFAPANPLITPDYIAPAWYLAPFYMILRAIPNKGGGVLLLNAALFIPLCLPWLDKSAVKSMRYKGNLSRIALTVLVISFLILGYLGTVPLTPSKLIIAQLCIISYFAYFLLMPWYSRLEVNRCIPARIG